LGGRGIREWAHYEQDDRDERASSEQYGTPQAGPGASHPRLKQALPQDGCKALRRRYEVLDALLEQKEDDMEDISL